MAHLVLLAAPLKIAAAGLGGVGVDDGLLNALSEKAAVELAQAPNVTVITRADVGALLGIERQKQLLGCAEDSSSCVTELAGALGADLVLGGDVAKVGARYSVTLKLLDARTGRATYSGAADAESEDALLEATKRLARAARVSLGGSSGVRWQPAVPLALGVVAGAGAAFLLVRAQDDVGRIHRLDATAASLAEGARLRDEGKQSAAIGSVLLGVAAAAVLAAVIWWVWP